ncbi:hypothetical protein C7C45_04930 [Micromonospora arborensis]|uniref:AAA+ ATPase domain-containing protein n=1 Tax=Micromonospora arborensis TaxID=2116518 RepID=A0A318NTV4_9ACTN|nr:hypothetical protein C7C45_04930 [Micromonospora arborensis]
MALERVKTDREYRDALAGILAEEEGTEADILHHLLAQEFTVRRLARLQAALVGQGVAVTPEDPEDGWLIGANRDYFTFPCPECAEEVQVRGSDPEEAPVDPFGYAQLTHARTAAAARCSLLIRDGRALASGDFTDALAERLGLKVAGVDLALVRLKRQMAGGQVDWLIPGVMERGTLAALFGPPGTGKSLLALEWAAKLAAEGRRVVYLDEENPPELMDERLEAMSVDPEGLEGLTYHSFPGWTADTEEGAARIVAACEGADLVVFDSWAKFFLAASQNDDAAANRAYRLAVKPLRAAGVGILRLDHTGHEEVTRPSGTVAKLADVDHNWQIKAKDLGDKRAEVTLVHRKSRTARGPRTINLRREVSPLRHLDAADLPAIQEEDLSAPTDKVDALVAFMDEKGWETDWTVDTYLEELRKLERGARKADVAAARRKRRERQPAA